MFRVKIVNKFFQKFSSQKKISPKMPLLIISGRPLSGKTTFSNNLSTFITEIISSKNEKPTNLTNLIKNNIDKVCLISDEDSYRELGLSRDEVYESTHVLEKRLRGNLKAATEKVLGFWVVGNSFFGKIFFFFKIFENK